MFKFGIACFFSNIPLKDKELVDPARMRLFPHHQALDLFQHFRVCRIENGDRDDAFCIKEKRAVAEAHCRVAAKGNRLCIQAFDRRLILSD